MINLKIKIMQTKIKNLRVRIDGLAQLTKELKPTRFLILDLAQKPPKIGVKEWMERIKKDQTIIIDSSKSHPYNTQQTSTFYQEVEKAKDSLLLAKAWLGKMLAELQPYGKIAIIVSRVAEADDYIRAKGLDREDCVVVFEERNLIGHYLKECIFLSIKPSFRKIIQEVTSETDIIKSLHSYFRMHTQWVGTPYMNNGCRKTVEDIEVPTDKVEPAIVGNPFNEEWKGKSHIERVDWLREEIKDIIDNTEDFSEEHDYIEIEQGFVYKHLSEARFWLGFELQRIKELEK